MSMGFLMEVIDTLCPWHIPASCMTLTFVTHFKALLAATSIIVLRQ